MHQDVRTVQALHTLASDIEAIWNTGKTMPANLERIVPPDATKDPTTRAMFIYHPKEGTAYELCATFLTDNRNETQSEAPFWRHGKGSYCFELNASQEPPPPPFSFTY